MKSLRLIGLLLGLVLGLLNRAVIAQPITTLPATTQGSMFPVGPSQNIFSDGDTSTLWVAQNMPPTAQTPPSEMTRIYVRSADSKPWKPVTEIPERAIGITSFGSQLAILFENGDWLLQSEEGGASGQPLPGGARLLTLASDGNTLWAIGTTPTIATTEPTTTAATTLPASIVKEPAARVVVYSLKGSNWTPADGAPMPANISPDTQFSLAVIDHVPTLAIRRANEMVEVLRQSPTGWQSAGQFQAPPMGGAFKLLSGLSPATLWIAGAESDRLEIFPAGAAHKTVPLKEIKAAITDRTSVFAINAIREIAVVKQQLAEDDYDDVTFTSIKKPETVALPPPAIPSLYLGIFRLAMMTVLGFAILSSFRRRRDIKDPAETEGVVAAELSRRFLAGLIDATPFIAPLFFLWQCVEVANVNPHDTAVDRLESLAIVTGLAALLVYLIHTAASEALTGRTIGKMLLGLRVVRLDGGTPDSSALLIRNFLRVIDIALMGVPLVFILYSPLRQRIGDVAAGTMVIRERVKPEGNLVEPVKTETPEEELAVPEPPEPAGE